MVNLSCNLFCNAVTNLKESKGFVPAMIVGSVMTGCLYGLGVAALAVSGKAFASLCNRAGYSSVAARIALPAVLTNRWVVVAISLAIPALILLTSKKPTLNKTEDGLINLVKNIYKSEDLNGEFLLQPLKTYHHFFANKIEHSAGLKKAVWLIAYVVTGIFAYPVFGALAGLGMLVKLTSIHGIRKHNQSGKNDIKFIQSKLKNCIAYATDSSNSIIQSGWQMKVIREFTVTKQNVNEIVPDIYTEINSLSSQFKKVYIASNGFINEGKGEIKIQLRIREKL